jgi:hypothetical protein
LQKPCQGKNLYIVNQLSCRENGVSSGRAEKVTKGQLQPGKNFLPDSPLQVSINHSCLAWLLRRHMRWRGVALPASLFLRFVLAGCVRTHASGTVMADEERNETDADGDCAGEEAKPPGKAQVFAQAHHDGGWRPRRRSAASAAAVISSWAS